MADNNALTRVSPLIDAESPLAEADGLSFTALLNTSCVQVMAFKQQARSVAAALGQALQTSVSNQPGICTLAASAQVAWNGPNQWMVISDTPAEVLCSTLSAALEGKAAVVDQSHGRSGFRLSGQRAASVMQKHCALDLHPNSFTTGQCALAPIAHIAALLIQVDDKPSYDIYVGRSFARSFAEVMSHACG